MNNATEQKAAARRFAEFWRGKGYEKGQTQPFWIDLLKVLGVADPERGFIEFEDKAHIDAAHGFIDGYIPATRVMVEQKSLGKNLRAAIPQSDGSLLTPFQQAKRYCLDLPLSRHPRWIVTCNFAELDIYDMEKPNAEPERLLLDNLHDELYRLHFLVDTGSDTIRREEEISKKAGDVVGLIYDALLKQYKDPSNPESLKSLNELCVRIVFLLYAEDADVFTHLQFHDYLARHETRDARRALIDLFRVLDTPPDKRDPYLEADLAAFPYVNGGLFANENVEIPQFTDEILDLVLRKGSEDFDWKDISPTIFGAVFESTLNPETRRSGGMHYTSVANIHKVIDPLFLDDLTRKVGEALGDSVSAGCQPASRQKAILALQAELASLTFLDPACGSGNFLTETYIGLRRLENRLLAALLGGQTMLDLTGDMVKVSLSQFHGIEINDFAAKVAKTALWIAENQMLRETEAIAHRNLDFLPLKNYDGIVEGNALRLDWPRTDYIIGNPPFIGARWMGREQKDDVLSIFGEKWSGVGDLDYVCCWFKKAADCMVARPTTKTALVATNSITQGGAPANLWKPLFSQGVSIDFAHRTFRWDSESNSKAHVHCVIVGFSCRNAGVRQKSLFDGDRVSYAPHINGYLLPAPDVFVEKRPKPLCGVPEIFLGGQPIDDGNLTLTEEEKDALLAREPQAAPLLRPFMMGRDFIERKPRWCLWLRDAEPSLVRSCPEVRSRVERVREFRLASGRASTLRAAETPAIFGAPVEVSGDYIALPKVSSEGRRYIPIDYLPQKVIPGDKLFVMEKSSPFHFGVLTSNVHMAWMRAVCGRLKSDYSYSNTIVYNNFPWPEPTEGQKGLIETTANAIIKAREAHPGCTFADLYDDNFMPSDLRRAHQENDRAVMAAYGFSTKMTESECVAELFKRYQALARPEEGGR
jgi:hypothetical protein